MWLHRQIKRQKVENVKCAGDDDYSEHKLRQKEIMAFRIDVGRSTRTIHIYLVSGRSVSGKKLKTIAWPRKINVQMF